MNSVKMIKYTNSIFLGGKLLKDGGKFVYIYSGSYWMIPQQNLTALIYGMEG